MGLAALLLILSTAMLSYCFQVTCQGILRRQFNPEHFQAVARTNFLEFLSLPKSLEGDGARPAYPAVWHMLERDFHWLTYLLKYATNVDLSYSNAERCLILYYRWHCLTWAVRHLMKAEEKKAIEKLTSVLQYFANVLGERVALCKVSEVRFLQVRPGVGWQKAEEQPRETRTYCNPTPPNPFHRAHPSKSNLHLPPDGFRLTQKT